MRKFFLFRRQEVSRSSTFASDSGTGVDIFGVPADLLAFMSAELGKVKIVFNNATPYEENNLVDGDSMQKTSVTVSCTDGKEADVIESIMRFIGSEGPRFNVMKFDAVEGFSNLEGVTTTGITDILSQVRKTPVERTSGDSSSKTFIGGTSGTAFGSPNSIQGIDFGSTANKPIVDYNESGITVSAGTSINGWTNSGTGGATYDCTTNGTPTKLTTVGRAGSGVNTVAADVTSSQYFVIGTELEVAGPFTTYMVLADNPSSIITQKGGRVMKGNIFGGADGTSFGIVGTIEDASQNLFSVRGDTFTGLPAQAPGNVAQQETEEDLIRTIDVFVLRRDEFDVMFIHDHTGEIIATFDESTVFSADTDVDGPKSVNDSGRQDGNLAIKNFGGAPLSPEPKFAGHIARFGVIKNDIGTERAALLATDLHDLYKPIS